MNDLENAEMAYATSMLGNPLLEPMMTKNVECAMLASTKVRNLQREDEKPTMDGSLPSA